MSTKNSFTLCPSFNLKPIERELLYDIWPYRGSFKICAGVYDSIYCSSNSSCVKLCLYLTVTALGHTMVLGNNEGRFLLVWKELCYGKAEMLGDAEEATRSWRDNLVRQGSGLRYCDVRWCGVVVLIRRSVVVCKIMVWDSDGTSEHKEWFEGGRWIVYKVSVVGVVGFPFFSLYSFSCIAKQVKTLKKLQLLSCLDSSKQTLSAFCFAFNITFELPISPSPDPALYTRTSPTTSYLLLNVPTSLDRV